MNYSKRYMKCELTCENVARALRLNSGRVYLIQPDNPPKGWNDGIGKCPIKIGVSKDIKGIRKRLTALGSGNWMELRINTYSDEILEPFNVEWFLHQKYSSERIKGEWYNLTMDEVRLIRKQLKEESYLQFVDAMKSDISSFQYYKNEKKYQNKYPIPTLSPMAKAPTTGFSKVQLRKIKKFYDALNARMATNIEDLPESLVWQSWVDVGVPYVRSMTWARHHMYNVVKIQQKRK